MATMRLILLIAILALSAACGAAMPAGPSSVGTGTVYHGAGVEALLTELDAIQGPLPWNGLTFREWAARVTIVVEPMAPYANGTIPGAAWDGRRVILNANLTGYDARGRAALIAHELRHADGARHTCGPEGNQDRRADGWTAYAVHVWTLEQLGEHDQARGNEGGFCD